MSTEVVTPLFEADVCHVRAIMSPLVILVLLQAVSNVFGETTVFPAPQATYADPGIRQVRWWNAVTRDSNVGQVIMRPNVVNRLNTGSQVRQSMLRFPVTKGYNAPNVPTTQPRVFLKAPSRGTVKVSNSQSYRAVFNNIQLTRSNPNQAIVSVPRVSPTFLSQVQIRESQYKIPTTVYAMKESKPQYSVRRVPQTQPRSSFRLKSATDKIVIPRVSTDTIRPPIPVQFIPKPLTNAGNELGRTQQSVPRVLPSVQRRINIPQVPASILTPRMTYLRSPALNQVSATPKLSRTIARKVGMPAIPNPLTLKQTAPGPIYPTPSKILQAPVVVLRPNPEMSRRLLVLPELLGGNLQMTPQPTIIGRNPFMSQPLNVIPNDIPFQAGSSPPVNVYSARNAINPIPQINAFQADMVRKGFNTLLANQGVNPSEHQMPYMYPMGSSFGKTPNTQRMMITEDNFENPINVENNFNYYMNNYPREDAFSNNEDSYKNENFYTDSTYTSSDIHPAYNQERYEQHGYTEKRRWNDEPYVNDSQPQSNNNYYYRSENNNLLDNVGYKTYNEASTQDGEPYHPEETKSDILNHKDDISSSTKTLAGEIRSNNDKPMDKHVEKLDDTEMDTEKVTMSESNTEESKLPEPVNNSQQKTTSFSDFLKKLSNPSRNVDNQFLPRMSINTKPVDIKPPRSRKVSESKLPLSILDRISNRLKERQNSGLPVKVAADETPKVNQQDHDKPPEFPMNNERASGTFNDHWTKETKESPGSEVPFIPRKEDEAIKVNHEFNREETTTEDGMKTSRLSGNQRTKPNTPYQDHPKESSSQSSVRELQESRIDNSIKNSEANNYFRVDQQGIIDEPVRNNEEDDNKSKINTETEMLANKESKFIAPVGDLNISNFQNESYESRKAHENDDQKLIERESTDNIKQNSESAHKVLPERIERTEKDQSENKTARKDPLSEESHSIPYSTTSNKVQQDDYVDRNQLFQEDKNIYTTTFSPVRNDNNISKQISPVSQEYPTENIGKDGPSEYDLSKSDLNVENDDVNIFMDKPALKQEGNPAHLGLQETPMPKKGNSAVGTSKNGLNTITKEDTPIHIPKEDQNSLTIDPNSEDRAAYGRGNEMINYISETENTQSIADASLPLRQEKNEYHMNINHESKQPFERNNNVENDGSNHDSGNQTTSDTHLSVVQEPKANDTKEKLSSKTINQHSTNDHSAEAVKESENVPGTTVVTETSTAKPDILDAERKIPKYVLINGIQTLNPMWVRLQPYIWVNGARISNHAYQPNGHIEEPKETVGVLNRANSADFVETEINDSNTVEGRTTSGTKGHGGELSREPARQITTGNNEYHLGTTMTTPTTVSSSQNEFKEAHKPKGLYHFLFNKVQELKKSGDIYKLTGHFPDEISTTTQSPNPRIPINIFQKLSEVSNITIGGDLDANDLHTNLIPQKDITPPTSQKSLNNVTQATNAKPESIQYIFVNGVREANPDFQPIRNHQGVAQYILVKGVWHLNPQYKPNHDENGTAQYILVQGEWKRNPDYGNPQAPTSLYRNLSANTEQLKDDDTGDQGKTSQYIVRHGKRYPNPDYKPQLNAAGVPNYILINGIWQLNPEYNTDEFPPQYIIIHGLRRLNPEWLRLQPYVWVNGEKMVNPEYVAPKTDDSVGQNDTTAQDSAHQEINSTIPSSSGTIPQYIDINGIRQLNPAWVQMQPYIFINGVRAPNPDYVRPPTDPSSSKTVSKDAASENKNIEDIPQYIIINGYQQINPEWEMRQPFIWVNGVKVPNPKYVPGTTGPTETSTAKPDVMKKEDEIPKYVFINGIQNLNPAWVRLQPYIWVNGARMANPEYQPNDHTEVPKETEQTIPKYIDQNGTQVINPEWAKLQPFIWVNGVQIPNPNYQPSPNR